MSRVAVACCRATPEAPSTDLYPDPDSDLLIDELRAIGVLGSKVAWDDPDVDWASFAAVIIRSTWDGIDRPRDYLDWAHRVSALTTLQNPAAIIEWNIDKTYLRDLERRDVPTIPTMWIAPGESWVMPEQEFIVKPAIGAGARNTARYSSDAAQAAIDHVALLGEAGQTALIQDYLPSVETEGETSIVFIDGQVTHAVRKGSFVNLNEGVVANPWERMTYLGRCEPSVAQLAIADRALAVAQETTAGPLCYARVDLIPNSDGEPVVIEMELIDPHLSLLAHPKAAAVLANAIVATM